MRATHIIRVAVVATFLATSAGAVSAQPRLTYRQTTKATAEMTRYIGLTAVKAILRGDVYTAAFMIKLAWR